MRSRSTVESKPGPAFELAGETLQSSWHGEQYAPYFERPSRSVEDKPVPEVTTKDYIDSKVDAVRAQNDARFAEVIGRIDGLSAKLDHLPSTGAMIVTAVTSALAVVGIVLAAMSYGGDRFDGGIGLADQRQEQLVRDQDQDAKLDTIITRLDALLDAQSIPPAPAPGSPTE